MLKITNLSKSYGNTKSYVVKDVSFELRPGEIFGFLGNNGAGKSTTIKSVVGILPFQKGTIQVNGQDIKKNAMSAKQEMGYVPDNHAVFERLTGREYVNHIANIYGVSMQDREQRAKKFLELFKLEYAYDRQIKSYSHGMKQKICVIATLLHRPKLWILDEPMTGLDPQSCYELKECMKTHAKLGNTVFFSSHVLDVVENLCDRVGILKSGELKGIYDIEKDIKSQDRNLEQLFMDIMES
ncbi:MAG: ABC transporter ATP-binding protein [Clostridiales bacterium]|jgi:ABC-2 type transport system ATP-binding protein|nr:ABC transporter ATP-binding protein [Clostridiales bacterium]